MSPQAASSKKLVRVPSSLTYQSEANRLSEIGEKIFLDRYAVKDPRKEAVAVDDLVVVNVNLETGQREIGVVTAITGNTATVALRDGSIVERDLEYIDKPVETSPEQAMDRVARGIASAEQTQEKRTEWEANFRWALEGWKFVPAGRILAAAGSEQSLTYYNCYVIPSPPDSRGGIFKMLSTMAEIFSRGGGVGMNLSSLRPRYSYVKGVNGRSSGAVSWGSVYSYVTGLIEQGGSRRGALMLILNVWHPDIFEFVTAKKKAGYITNANISVGITDDFMRAVDNDDDWDLVFPDRTGVKNYDELWDGDLKKWKEQRHKVNVYKTVKARDLWKTITESAWASAEPGLYFMDRANYYSNSWYFGPLNCTNPCGEQPLPSWGVCNLGAINLSKFVDRERQDVRWEELGKTIRIAVRFLDNVIDATPYFFDENEKQQKSERRVGLNSMGLAEMLIKLKLRYGSRESLEFIDRLYEFFATEAYLASVDIAKEKGAFPQFDAEKFLQSGYMREMPRRIREAVAKDGIRNVTLLTQAPNGTTGTMMGTSTGIEPFYSWTYWRKSRLGTHEENVKLVSDWKEAHPGQELPDYFVTAMELTPEEHVSVIAAIQRWVDAALSKTTNCPEDWTPEQVADLYQLMYRLGAKGGTIYRDNSRDQQVLMLKDKEYDQQSSETAVKQSKHDPDASTTLADVVNKPAVSPRERPQVTRGWTYKIKTGYGSLFVTINEDNEGRPFELFTSIGKNGGFFAAKTEAISRLISLAFRSGVPAEEVIDQLKGIRGPNPFWSNGNLVLSIPDAIAQLLEQHIKRGQTPLPFANGNHEQDASEQMTMLALEAKQRSIADLGTAPICPQCGGQVIPEEGCLHCANCGWSQCT